MPAVALACSTAAVLLPVGGGQAWASHVECGDVISSNTTLDSDLHCPNNGVLIGAAGITLDLDNHRIIGDGKPSTTCDPKVEPCDIGVLNDGFNGVTIEHGSVRGFALGGLSGAARKNRLLDVGATRNDIFGWVLFDLTRSVIRGGAFRRNIPPEGDGLGVFGCDHVRIRNNKIRNNPGPGLSLIHI